jgi:hypothetical protein
VETKDTQIICRDLTVAANIMNFALDVCPAGRPSARLPLNFSGILK